MNEPYEVACSICGTEHDPKDVPELDSTHLCSACTKAQRALAMRVFIASGVNDAE